ncbi:beta strand repeat-containing protein [Luteolibacter sp. Populi]|uniref:beta strand repeat-containing protein n=1 Tax=Luteolibacter sp. Populi TaxID=3230487 RepID=UPI0034656D5A
MTIPKHNLRSTLLHAALLSAVTSLPTLHAATQTYSDANPANVWDLATLNWDASSAAWIAGNDAVFGGTGEAVELNGAVTANSVTFSSEGYSLVDASNDGSLTLTGTRAITTASGVSATISDIVLGTAGLTKDGTGTLILNGANTYTGVTAVSDGILQVNANSGGKIYTVAAPATLQLGYTTGASVYNYGVTVTGAGTAATTGLYLKGGVLYNLQSTLTLQTAPTTVRGFGTGSATLAGWDTNGTHLSVPATGSGSVLDANINFAPGSYGYVMNIASGANTATGDVTFLGPLTGATNANSTHFRKTGAGSLVLAGASTNAAPLDIRVGSVILSGGANRIGTGATVIIGNGTGSGKLVLNGNDQTLANLYTVGTGTTNAVTGGAATTAKLTVNYGGTGHTFAGTLGGAGTNENNLSLVKAGTGAYTLSGTNTYTGGTTITGGTLVLGSAGALGTSGTIALAGGTLQFTAANTTDYTATGRLKFEDGALSAINTNGVDVILANSLPLGSLGTAGFGKAGAGTLTLAAAQSFTGATTVSGGVLALDYSAADSSKLSDTAALTLAGGTLRLAGGSHAETVLSTLVTGNSIIERTDGTATIQLGEVTRTGTATLDIAAAGIAKTSLTNDVSGKLPPWITVGGQPAANDGSGNIIAYGGFVNVVRLGGKIPNNPTANVKIVDGGTTGDITPLTSGLTDIATLLQGAAAGPATVSLAEFDTLRLGAEGVILVPPTSGSLAFQGGILTAGGLDETAGNISIDAGAPVTIGSMLLDNGVEGIVSLTKTGSSSLTLAETNAHSGGTTLNAGELRINHFQGMGIGSLTINGGSLDNTSGESIAVMDTIDQFWNADINFTGSNELAFPEGVVTLGGNRTVNVQNSFFEVGDINGAFGITKTGAGTFVIGGGNWSGVTTVSAGTMEIFGKAGDAPLVVEAAGTLKIAHTNGGGYANSNLKVHGAGTAATTGLYLEGSSTYNGAGTLQLLDAPTTIRHSGTGVAGIGQFDINADALTTVAASSGSVIDTDIQLISRGYGMSLNIATGAATATGDLVINGALNIDNLGLYKRGAGSILLNAEATALNKAVKIQAGSVIAGTANVLGANAELQIAAGTKLVMNGFSQAAGSLSGAGQVVNPAATPATLTIKQAADLTFSGILGGTGATEHNFSLVKSGPSKLTLSGANTYAGSTTVAEGTLSLGTVFLPDAADVILGTDAVLELTTGATDVIDELTVNGSGQIAGVYGAVGSGAQFERSFITGTGTLTVTTGTTGGYTDWETANEITGAGSNVDSDNDGIPNGIEFVIGGDPSGPSSSSSALLPTVTENADYMTIVFRRSDESVTYNPHVQYGTTLGSWTESVNGQPLATPVLITTEDDGFETGIDRVTVKIPRALAAPGSKLFGRLTVNIP